MDKAHSFGLVAVLGVVACGTIACSTSNPGSPKTDGGGVSDTGGGSNDTGPTFDSGAVVDSGTTSTDTGSTEDTGVTCGSDPTLHPAEAGVGPYCPGYYPSGSTTSGSCSLGQTCCEQTTGSPTPSSCTSPTSACPSGDEANWECDGPSMCEGSTRTCCGNGTPAIRPGCTYLEVYPTQGTVCAATCGATQYVVCESDADCTGSKKTCTPLKSGGKQIGACQ